MNTNMERVLRLQDVKMRFLDNQVLKGINLDVYRGQIIGYIGPNGAGKSTTLKIILGLLEGYEGTVEVFGKKIEIGNVDYKRKIGYVPENAEVYDMLTASEYLTFVGEMYGMDRKQAENKALALMTELGMESAFYERISSYSKGMRQRVLIVASLLHDPDLIFLDEPLSGLDANSVMIIKDLLAELAAMGKTIFYSSHIMDVVEKISNRIVLLVDGEIAADGSFDELKNSSEKGSLEAIFNQLTGFESHQETAENMVNLVMGEEQK